MRKVNYIVKLSGNREIVFSYYPMSQFSQAIKEQGGTVRLFSRYSEEVLEGLLYLQTTPEVKVGHIILYDIPVNELENLFGILSVLQKLTLTLVPRGEDYEKFYSQLFDFLFQDPAAFCYVTWMGHLIFLYNPDVEDIIISSVNKNEEKLLLSGSRLERVRKLCIKCPLFEKGCNPRILALEILSPEKLEKSGLKDEMEKFCKVHRQYALKAGEIVKEFLESKEIEANAFEREKANIKGVFWIDPLNIFRKTVL